MKDFPINYILSAVSTFMACGAKDVEQIILFAIGIASALFSFIVSIMKWYKEAKKDGNITSEELGKLEDIVENGIDKITGGDENANNLQR